MADRGAPPGREWQVPGWAVRDTQKLGWLDESVQEGQSWLRSQRGYSDISKALNTLAGRDTTDSPADYRSRLNTNRLKRNVREVVGTLSKLRPLWGYQSDNSAYKSHAEMMNNVTRAWYLESFADRAIRDALQYAAATCRGWVRPVYRRGMGGTGRGDLTLLTYGSPCVLPNQLPASGNWQDAYVVHILEEMPVYLAHGMFPTFQDRLLPSSSRYWYQNDGVRQASQGNWLKRAFGGGGARAATDAALSDSLIPVRYTYIIDLSINTTSAPIPMGEAGASWAYTVPFIGQEIPAGRDLATGKPLTRRANETDARMYPYRRLIISTDRVVTYDGPAFDWHGMFPGVSFCMDESPWEPIGFSLVHDGYEINEAIKKIYRGNMDKISSQLDMSLVYDINAVSKSEAERFDPMQPRARIGADRNAGEGPMFESPIPHEVLQVTPESLKMIEMLEAGMDAQMHINDVAALARMRAVGSMDDIEKVMEANGPTIEDISRSMEPPMRDLGVMVKYGILQNYTTPRIMQYVGMDGITPQVFDYDPASLIPSHLVGEVPMSEDGKTKIPSAHSAAERARIFADNLRFFILPGSLHEYTQMSQKLALIQLKKSGVIMDSQTIAEAFNVPGYGKIDGSTVLERAAREKEMELEFQARLAMIAASAGLQGAQPPQAASAPPGAPKPNGAGPEGRPPTNAKPAHIEQKDNNVRSTISTS
jgi:hypothetical protein